MKLSALTQAKIADVQAMKTARDNALVAQTWVARARKKIDAGDYETAKTMLLKAAELAQPDEAVRIAQLFIHGDWGQSIDYDTVITIADGLPDAQKYGLYTRVGTHFARYQNEEKAIALLEPAAESGNTEAMRVLAEFYSRFVGRYNPDAIDRSNMLYDLAIANGDPLASFAKARDLLRLPNVEDSAMGIGPMTQLISDPRYKADALTELAKYYADSRYKPPDYFKAYEHYNQIESPTPLTKKELAKYLVTGAGGVKDAARARRLLEENLDDPVIGGDILLGHFYRLGIGGPRDPEKAFTIYESFERFEQNPAGHFIGAMYAAGELDPPDGQDSQEAAIIAYEKGKAAGTLTAYVLLARAYETGNGVEQNPEIAFELMRYAGEGGSNMGRQGMADYFERGVGREPHIEMAEIWLNKVRLVTDPLIFNCDICDPQTD